MFVLAVFPTYPHILQEPRCNAAQFQKAAHKDSRPTHPQSPRRRRTRDSLPCTDPQPPSPTISNHHLVLCQATFLWLKCSGRSPWNLAMVWTCDFRINLRAFVCSFRMLPAGASPAMLPSRRRQRITTFLFPRSRFLEEGSDGHRSSDTHTPHTHAHTGASIRML
jgi:hypothetical protein